MIELKEFRYLNPSRELVEQFIGDFNKEARYDVFCMRVHHTIWRTFEDMIVMVSRSHFSGPFEDLEIRYEKNILEVVCRVKRTIYDAKDPMQISDPDKLISPGVEIPTRLDNITSIQVKKLFESPEELSSKEREGLTLVVEKPQTWRDEYLIVAHALIYITTHDIRHLIQFDLTRSVNE